VVSQSASGKSFIPPIAGLSITHKLGDGGLAWG